MLNSIIRFSLNHRLLVVSLTALLIVYGSISVLNLPIDVFPDITKPTVTIMTEGHGMAPEEVETRVTYPIESYLNGIPGVERLRSQSGIGLSVIYVEFEWGTDIYRNRQLVQEKLNLAQEQLPLGVKPIMGPIGSLMGQIQQIAVTTESEQVSPMELRNLAEWVIRPRLMTIQGVSQIISIGGGLKQYQILVSAEKLNRYQLTIEDLDKELTVISQNTTGGFLEKEGQEFLVRNIGVVNDVDDIKQTLVGMHFGRPVLVSDIADVQEAPRLKRGDGSFNGHPAVIMTVQKQPGADTVKITESVEKAIAELQPAMPAGVKINPDVFKQANFIENSIKGIQGKLKMGTVLVFVILFIFLANLRMSAITLTAIPVSFLATAIIFKYFGLSVNTMTLGGLAIAIGELVDDSIVDVENVFRRLRENAKSANPLPKLKVIFEASSEVRNSIVLATVIIALVFLPLFNLTGLEGRLFAPLGIAYLTALISSLIVSLTLTPVLCSYFLKIDEKKEHHDTAFLTFLKNVDRKILQWALPRSNAILGGSVVLLVGALSLIPFMGRDFLPQFNEGTAMISLVAPPGISLTESNAMGLKAEKILLEIPEIKSVSRRTGRAEMDEHAMGVNVSELDVDFKGDGRSRDVVLNDVRDKLKAAMPEAGINVGQPISHLIDHMLSGVTSALAIKIFGPDLVTLREKSIELQEAIKDIDGLVDLRIEQQGLIPQVKVQVLRDEAAKFGLSAGEVTHLLESAFNGKTVAQIMEETRIYDVFLQFDQSSRTSIETMQKTVLKIMPDGRKVFLEDVADVYETYGPNEINRENNQRRIVISANVSGRDLGSLVSDIQQRVQQDVKLPEGYYVIYGGQFESQQQATRNILLFGIISILGIALVLYSHFKSQAITAQIMATIPLAFIGGIVLLFFTDRSVTVASLVGFITLCGVASRNGIMMISHYLHLMKYENEKFSMDMIIRGSQERLSPVMMTAFVASLALLPLVFAKGQPGSEILHPVAVVIVGGLLSSTLLDIIVTPTLFYRFGRKSAEAYVNPKLNEQLTKETI
ncbi:efflux RND transporter permease subunit [Pseudobdellovibrio exovorus]|uniref:Cation efflux system protein, AcrB/AcrD/AcrF family protein n=1 Tax=Pseudobdellovibrio exovorus JSS TaxID=1184267 RepID=M4VNP2_9BACT|nr:efflux RND transporter permease subunit [Pseudobdellovibrio exovorus]AGH94729.1 cation efflux system protein, AcrB/AcrD/AcrF family protein [Pseudobdellovibrio exovorus JSS]